MLYFDFMEKKDSSEDLTDHMLPSLFEKFSKATGTDGLFHQVVVKQ